MARSFLPTWIGAALLIAIQLIYAGLLYDPPAPRAAALTPDGAALILVVLGSAVAVVAFPRQRPASLLIGALTATVVTLHHTAYPYGAAAPPEELFGFYTVAAVLLASGAVLMARPPADRPPIG